VIAVILAVSLAAGGGVTPAQVEAAHAGQARAHVENVVFAGVHGHRVGMVATDERRILWKRYPMSNGNVVKATYYGPLCDCGPLVGPYHLRAKKVIH
jgi:hypothetical protein